MEQPKPFTLVSFQAEAELIVQAARDQARELLTNAAAEAERIREMARQKGIEEGRTEAIHAGVRKVLDEVEKRRGDLEAEAERDLLRLAMAVAEKIVKRKIVMGRAVAEANLKSAIGRASHLHILEIRMHPGDVPKTPAPDGAAFVADPSIEPGGCVVRAAEGVVKLDLKTQFDRLSRALLGAPHGRTI